ncbi:MAG: hypothetical protein C4295_10495 [Candidatus Fervidibacterota bacterium]
MPAMSRKGKNCATLTPTNSLTLSQKRWSNSTAASNNPHAEMNPKQVSTPRAVRRERFPLRNVWVMPNHNAKTGATMAIPNAAHCIAQRGCSHHNPLPSRKAALSNAH